MVGSVFFASQRWTVMCESQRMCRSIKLRDNLHAHLLGIKDKIVEPFLGIVAVLGGQAGEEFTLDTESRIGLVPIAVEVIAESIIVQMHLQGVHLVIREQMNQAVQIGEGNVLTAHIYHHTAHRIGRCIGNGSAGKRFALHLQLLQCLNAPHDSLLGLSLDGDALRGDGQLVAFLSQFLVLTELEANRAAFTQGGRDVTYESRQIPGLVQQGFIVVADVG